MQQPRCNTNTTACSESVERQADSLRGALPWDLRSRRETRPLPFLSHLRADAIMPTANATSFSDAVSEHSGRRTDRPRVSVVLNSTNAEHETTLLERSIRWKHLDIEVVIVSTEYPGVSARVFGDTRRVYAPADSSRTQRRALGLAAASGDLVIMMDGSQQPDDAWLGHLAGDISLTSPQAQQ